MMRSLQVPLGSLAFLLCASGGLVAISPIPSRRTARRVRSGPGRSCAIVVHSRCGLAGRRSRALRALDRRDRQGL